MILRLFQVQLTGCLERKSFQGILYSCKGLSNRLLPILSALVKIFIFTTQPIYYSHLLLQVQLKEINLSPNNFQLKTQ